MKQKLIDLYGLSLALTLLGTLSGLILVVSCGTALPALWYFWSTGQVDYYTTKRK